MHVAGFFRRLNITQAEADRLLDRAGRWAKDDKVKDRLDAVRNTYSMSEDAPITGGKKLEESMANGKDFVASLQKIWGGEQTGVSKNRLEQMNAKHAVLFNQSGNVVVMTEAKEDGKLQLRYSSAHEFSMLYPQLVQVGVTSKGAAVMKKLGAAWIEHPKRRFYNGIELAPNGKSNEGYYNMWQGFSVEPKAGSWELFKRHLLLLVNNDVEHAKYMLAWMAETVQHPERPIGIAPAFKGEQGTGKSTFAKWFGELFGPHFLHLDSEHRLLGQFNSHLHNAILVLADEAVWAGGKIGLGALKRMITERTLAIERKGMDVINVKNMLHMMVASNEDWFVPVGFDNRRFAVFNVAKDMQNNTKFFGAVEEELFEKGGLAAMLYDLLQYKSDVNLREIPNTDELDRQKKHSMSAKHAWWYEQLQSGAPWSGATEIPREGEFETVYEIDPDTLYAAYVTAVRLGDNRLSPGFQASLSRFIKTVLPDPYPTQVQHAGKRYWVLPSLEQSRKYFDSLFSTKSEWFATDGGDTKVDVPF